MIISSKSVARRPSHTSVGIISKITFRLITDTIKSIKKHLRNNRGTRDTPQKLRTSRELEKREKKGGK